MKCVWYNPTQLTIELQWYDYIIAGISVSITNSIFIYIVHFNIGSSYL